MQLLIDRLIFVKVLSDREIEDDYLAQLAETVEGAGLAENDAGWFVACRDIFEKLDAFYNGSIFEPRPELEAVSVSNKVVRDMIRALQPENSPYNFAVLPVEILGTIYERFLGRVVRATEKQVKIEEKPEVRKAGRRLLYPAIYRGLHREEHGGKTAGTLQDARRCRPAQDPRPGLRLRLVSAGGLLRPDPLAPQYYAGQGAASAQDRAARLLFDSDGACG